VAVRLRLVLSRFTVSDRCNETSVVTARRGRVYVRDHNKGASEVLPAGRTYVAKPRRRGR
jgi:hypothetical protein